MITTPEFKKQIAKPFGAQMRKYGYKGTGLEYRRDIGDCLTSIYIEPSQWGGKCTVGFAIHPKAITKNYNGQLNLEKLKIYDFEFKMSLTESSQELWWNYSDDEFTNLATLNDILVSIKRKCFPVIEQFLEKPNILDTFELSEMADFHENWTIKTGVSIAMTDSQFAWAMILYCENKYPAKAKQFAKWLISLFDSNDYGWYSEDILRVLTKNEGE